VTLTFSALALNAEGKLLLKNLRLRRSIIIKLIVGKDRRSRKCGINCTGPEQEIL
jgi:hypothetical protein